MLRRRILVLALLLASLSGLVLASDGPATNNAKLFNPSLSEARIAADIYYLTTEECEGRGSTTQGIHKAADYLVSRLKQAGLQPAGDDNYFQYFDFNRGGARPGPDSTMTLKAGDITVEVAKNELQVLGVGNAGHGEAGLAFVGYGITSEDPAYDDYKGIDVEGKAVLILRKTPRQSNEKQPNFKGKESLASVQTKVREASKRKAAAIILVNDQSAGEPDPLTNFATYGTRADKSTPPVFHLKRGIVDQILLKAGMKSIADLEKEIDEEFKPASKVLADTKVAFKADVDRGPFKIKNIIATVPGAGDLADEIVVVGSHYDHVGRGETGSLAGSREIHFGADDNGSGSVTNLEIARRWQELQSGPNAQKNRRRVVFQWYAAEEWGLIGSDYYTKNPLFPLDKTASMLNLDMVGRYGFDQFKVGPNQDPEEIKKRNWPLEVLGTSSAKEFPDLIKDANKDLGVNIKMPNSSQYFSASDHYSFYKKNIPVIFFFTGMHPQYHRPTDTFQTVNIKGMRQVAELGQNILERLTTMERPQFVKTTNTAPRVTTGRPGGSIGIRPAYNDDKDGVLVDGVSEGRAAEKAGIKAGDRILEIDGKPVKNVSGYMELLGKAKAGDKLEVLVDRKGEKVKLTVIYEGARPATPTKPASDR